MKKNANLFLSLIFFIALIQPIQSQTLSGAFTVTGAGYSTAVVSDYQCVGLNPANLGWKRNSHLMNVGIGESDISIYSEPLKRSLVNDLFNSNKTFSSEERDEAVENFTNTKLQLEGSVSGFGVSFQDEKIGGFGFIVRERLVWDSQLNEQSSDILFRGYHSNYFDSLSVDPFTGDTTGWSTSAENVTELFEGTHLDMLWFREYNFSYGRSIINRDNFTLYGGIGIKYIEGYSVFNYSYAGNNIRAFSALNPVLGVDYDQPSPSKINNDKYQRVGNGWGLDFGVSALILKKIRIAVAVTDIGSIKWDGNVYSGEDALLTDIQTAGIENYNIFDAEDNVALDNLKWGGWEGLENKTTQLPLNLRVGGAFILNEKFEFGTELYAPLNDTPGAYDKVYFGLGTRITPVRWLRLSTGMVTGGETGTNVPMGISFIPFNNSSFSWEIGFAVRDIITYFSQDKPTVSYGLGLLRFSFGNLSSSNDSSSITLPE
ncbi:MAG: hypothetical protein KQI35_13585 [Bacteroidetes bacterium]|nr:hypothetical protein [Bacteroidota bacterium]